MGQRAAVGQQGERHPSGVLGLLQRRGGLGDAGPGDADAHDRMLLAPDPVQRGDDRRHRVGPGAHRLQRQHRPKLAAAEVAHGAGGEPAHERLDALGDLRPRPRRLRVGLHRRARREVDEHVRAAQVAPDRPGPRLGGVHVAGAEGGEQVAHGVLGGQALDEMRSVERHRDLVGDGAQELVVLVAKRPPRRHREHAERVGSGRDRGGEHGEPVERQRLPGQAARPAAAQDGAQQRLGLRRSPRQRSLDRHARGQLEGLAVLVEQVELAARATQQRAHAAGHRRVELLAAVDGGDLLAEPRQRRQRLHPLARLLQQLGVLDRSRHERRGLGEEVEHPAVELARCLGVQHDDPDDLARARRHRHGDHRLEALLVQLGHVLHARVGERVLADELGRVVAGHPAREPLVDAELDLADEVRVDPRRGVQPQAAPLAQVDEARVAARGLREDLHDPVEHAIQIG